MKKVIWFVLITILSLDLYTGGDYTFFLIDNNLHIKPAYSPQVSIKPD